MAGRKPKLISYNGKNLISDSYRVGYDKTNNTYVIFKHGKRITKRKHLQDAAQEFYTLADENKHIDVLGEPENIDVHELEEGLSSERYVKLIIDEDGSVTKTDIHKLTPTIVITEFVKLLKDDPNKVAAISKIPQFARWDTIDLNPKIKISFDDIINAYRNRIKKPPDEKSIIDAVNWFNEFKIIIEEKIGKKIRYINDINKTHIIYYEEELYRVATIKRYKHQVKWLNNNQKKRLSNKYPKKTWFRHRVNTIKTLLKNYIKINKLTPDEHSHRIVTKVLELIRTIDLFKPVKPLPKKIDVDTFQRLYNISDLRWKTILALSLNCGFTLVDIENTQKSDIDLHKKELVKYREKNEEFRCALLHNLVIRLLKLYMKKFPNDTDYIFVSYKTNTPLKSKSLCSDFHDIRAEAGVNKNVKFKQLRKTTASVAAEAGCSNLQIELLIGHNIGVKGHYIENSIEVVKPACKAITNKYLKGLKI